MSFLDRFRGPRYEVPRVDNTAIPLTPKDVELLIVGLQQAHRIDKERRPGRGVGSSAGNQADEMLRRIGVTHVAGSSTVPFLCRELPSLEYALGDLRHYTPHSHLGRRFEGLVSKMKVLAGMARARGWTAKLTDTTVWETEPDARQVLGRLEVES